MHNRTCPVSPKSLELVGQFSCLTERGKLIITRESDTMGLTLLLFKEILPLPVGYLCIHGRLQGPGTLLENQEAQ